MRKRIHFRKLILISVKPKEVASAENSTWVISFSEKWRQSDFVLPSITIAEIEQIKELPPSTMIWLLPVAKR